MLLLLLLLPQTNQLLLALDSANLTQHVHFPTHRDKHTLDLVITQSESTLSPTVTFSPISPSNHFPIFSSLTSPAPPPLATRSFRSIKSINVDNFTYDILCSRLITRPPTGLTDLLDAYNYTLTKFAISMLLSSLNLLEL